MALTQKFQLFAKEEAQPGVFASTLFTEAGGVNADFEPISPSAEISVDDVQRDIVRGTLTKATPISGMREATIRFGIELTGHKQGALSASDWADALPAWAPLLRACGMHREFHKILQIDTTTAWTVNTHFLHGETIIGGTSGGTGLVVHDTHEGQATIRYVPVNGTPFSTAETITGSTSLAVATLKAQHGDTKAGSSWWPVSKALVTFDYTAGSGTIDIGDILRGEDSGALLRATVAGGATGTAVPFEVLDGVIATDEVFNNITPGNTGTLTVTSSTLIYEDWPTVSLGLIEDGRAKSFRGCRGTVTIDSTVGQPVVLNFEFRGLYQATEDLTPVTVTTRTNRQPVVWRGGTFQAGQSTDDFTTEFRPRVSQFSLDMGNSLAFRKDANDTEGHTEVMITERSATVSFDPELQPEAAFGFLASMLDGTPFRLRYLHGQTGGDRFLMTTPGAKVTGAGVGDRDGLATSDIQANLSGRAADGQDREDNEIVLSYETISVGW